MHLVEEKQQLQQQQKKTLQCGLEDKLDSLVIRESTVKELKECMTIWSLNML